MQEEYTPAADFQYDDDDYNYECCCVNYNCECCCVNYNREFELEEDDDDVNSLHDKCKELCDTFQIPNEYSKTIHTNLFNDDRLIEEYKKLNDPEFYYIKSFLIESIRNQVEMINYEQNCKLKKVRFFILIEFLNMKKSRELITSHNKLNDIVSNKIKKILIDHQDDQVLVNYVKNNLTLNI